MQRNLIQKIDAGLAAQGFFHPDVRLLVRNQLLLAGATSLLALPLSFFTPAGWSFAAGAALVTLNFWPLAKFGQNVVFIRKGAVASLLVRFYGRMIVTGLCIYLLVAWGNASAGGLLAGLSTVVANAVLYGAAGMRRKVKEA